MSADDADAIVRTIRREIEEAAEVMLSAAEKGLRALAAARGGQEAAFDQLELTLCAILEACAFQDITGQRLSRLEEVVGTDRLRPMDEEGLLNGPALPGAGLDQAAANGLLGETP